MLAAVGKKALVVVIVTAGFLWLLHSDMPAAYCPYSIGDIQSGSELLLYRFPIFKVSGVAQIFVLEISKKGLENMDDKFSNGGLDNQLLILQGGVGSPDLLANLRDEFTDGGSAKRPLILQRGVGFSGLFPHKLLVLPKIGELPLSDTF